MQFITCVVEKIVIYNGIDICFKEEEELQQLSTESEMIR